MLRLVELALFLAPFAIFVVWRVLAKEGGPSMLVLVIAGSLLVVLAGALVWLRQEETLPPRSAYEPARLQDGEIVSGHAVPR